MKIKMKYDTVEVEMDVEINELTGWLGIEITEEESEEDMQKRVQEKIDEDYNRPDYNNWHRHNRHVGYSKAKYDGEDVETGHFREPLMEEVKDKSIFYKEQLVFEKEEMYARCCGLIREACGKKQDLAEAFIKVILDDYTIRELTKEKYPKTESMSDKEYESLIRREENNLSKKLVRLKGRFEKVSPKTSDFDVFQGYLLEAIASKKF